MFLLISSWQEYFFQENIFAKKVIMPTIFIIFGIKFKFYSNDHTPIHVHVEKGGARAKYQLFPIELIENYGFKTGEIKLIESIICNLKAELCVSSREQTGYKSSDPVLFVKGSGHL